MQIRPATAPDLPALLEIYNHYVRESHVTFDLSPLSLEARRAWLEAFDGRGAQRLLVGEVDDTLVGYACSQPFRRKAAYDSSVETSVYLAHDATGRGLGRALYGALLDGLTAHPDLHRAYGGVAQPNPASNALHLALGFSPVGTYREVGFKFDRYWDVRWYERSLD